jgi:hypothetical protein
LDVHLGEVRPVSERFELKEGKIYDNETNEVLPLEKIKNYLNLYFGLSKKWKEKMKKYFDLYHKLKQKTE